MACLTGYDVMRYGKDFFDGIECSKKLIIYGAGNISRQCLSMFGDDIKGKVIGIAVTALDNNEHILEGIQVKCIDTYAEDIDSTVIIAIKDKGVVSTVRDNLERMGFRNILHVEYEMLKLYRTLAGIKRSKKLLESEEPFSCPGEREIFDRALNVGRFIEECGKQSLEFETLSMTWGGSGMLDYALLQSLVLRYQISAYLEIGTYIGDSLTIISNLVEKCYSISVPEEHPAHMKNWCHLRHMNDYSNRLVTGRNMIQYQEDSKEFDFEKIKEDIGLYFIDGDHSYEGVLIDSLKVMDHFNPIRDFIVWHDCRYASGAVNLDIVRVIYEASGEYFKNFYIFDNCMCGIYIPDKYVNDFVKAKSTDKLITYKVVLSKNENEL